jgi:uncharacterized protein (DUF305 family)
VQSSKVGKSLPALLAACVVAALALTGCDLAGFAPPTPSPATGARTPGIPDSTPYAYYVRDDLQFIDMMVPHHQLAIDMARVAEQHAQHGQVLGLARDIIAAQDDEIHRMLIWRGELAGSSPTPGMSAMGGPGHSSMPGMNVDLKALAASPDFDRAFIEAMIPHHQSAIDMSRAATPNLKRPEIRDLAHDIITTQQVEIDRMEGWLKEWYP